MKFSLALDSLVSQSDSLMTKHVQIFVLLVLFVAHVSVLISFGWKLPAFIYWGSVGVLFFLLCFAYWWQPKFEQQDRLASWKDVFALVIGCVLTFSIHSYTDMGAVLSASIVGFSASFLPTSFGASIPGAIYCGAFVGMTTPAIVKNIGGWPTLLLAAILAGILFTFSKTVFRGVGGKHGTIALVGITLATLIVFVLRYVNVLNHVAI